MRSGAISKPMVTFPCDKTCEARAFGMWMILIDHKDASMMHSYVLLYGLKGQTPYMFLLQYVSM